MAKLRLGPAVLVPIWSDAGVTARGRLAPTSRLVLPVAMPALVGQLTSPEQRWVVVAEHATAERALASQQGPRLRLHRRRLDQALLSRAWYRRGLDLNESGFSRPLKLTLRLTLTTAWP
jgi:hypothetical protein